MQFEVIRGHQEAIKRPSEAIRGNQWPSDAIRGHPIQSDTIRYNRMQFDARAVIRGH
ncbi:hypothetical protein Ctob_002465, partial [Chrysochromulina tobinii]